jgi:hypothetical protein
MARVLALLGLAGTIFVTWRLRFLGLSMIALSSFGIVLTGSRGPLMGMLFAAAFALIILNTAGRMKLILLLLCGGCLAVAVLSGFDLGMDLRGLDFSFDEGTAAIRSDTFAYAVDLIREYPGGIGVGNFEYNYLYYPHNIFLEFLAEWGYLFGGLAITIVAWGSYRALRLPHEYNILKVILISELVNASISGDITSPRMLYGVLLFAMLPASARGSRAVRRDDPLGYGMKPI